MSLSLSVGRGVPVPSVAGAVPAQSQLGTSAEDRYAALAELDNELSSSAPTGSSVQGWETDATPKLGTKNTFLAFAFRSP